MKEVMRKIALMMLVGVLPLTALRAMPTFPVTIFTLAPEEETEKLINNVKVFYNPVAEQITVSFKLSKQSVVTIKVMDALGNEVLNLMNGRLDGGMQNLSFEANGKLTTGFYFVRVTSGAETVVKRISVR